MQPRRYAKSPGSFVLIPLLPQKPQAVTLPTELWIKILGYVFAAYYTQAASSSSGSQSFVELRQNLLLVCKNLRVRYTCDSPYVIASTYYQYYATLHLTGYRASTVLPACSVDLFFIREEVHRPPSRLRQTMGLYQAHSIFYPRTLGSGSRPERSAVLAMVGCLSRRRTTGSTVPPAPVPGTSHCERYTHA